jgi:hypothetical protein
MRSSVRQKKMHCCEAMKQAVNSECVAHPDRFTCPDALIDYIPKFDEYGIIIHDGGSSVRTIIFCPWCGTKLPESKRDRWFDELEAKGYSTPGDPKIPGVYRDARWYSKK